jgi:hypothetical protein
MKKGNIRLTYWFITLGCIAFISACGGGGGDSNSGGGGDDSTRHAGTYKGPTTINIQIAGSTVSDSFTVTFVINPNGTVTITADESGDTSTGMVSGDTISWSEDFNFSEDGVTCTGSASGNGTIDGNTINGSYSSNSIVCNGLPVNITGSFSANMMSASAFTFQRRQNGRGILRYKVIPGIAQPGK